MCDLSGKDKVQLIDLEFQNFKLIKDKYNRIVDGINHGRTIFYHEVSKTFIKIFHPEYCRLQNFQNAIESGLFNGLVPALDKLIYDGDTLIGYVMKAGKTIADNDYDFDKIPNHFMKSVLENCKKRNKIYYDLVPQNVICLENGQYSLIDLESVYEHNQEDIMLQHNATYKPSNLLKQLESI